MHFCAGDAHASRHDSVIECVRVWMSVRMSMLITYEHYIVYCSE